MQVSNSEGSEAAFEILAKNRHEEGSYSFWGHDDECDESLSVRSTALALMVSNLLSLLEFPSVFLKRIEKNLNNMYSFWVMMMSVMIYESLSVRSALDLMVRY